MPITRKKRIVKQSERELHAAVCDFLDLALVQPAWWTLFPAGGKGRSWQSLRGLKRGVPDILIVHAGCAFWIEEKTEDGRLTVDQTATIGFLGAAGCKVAIARSVEEVADLLRVWEIPMRDLTIGAKR